MSDIEVFKSQSLKEEISNAISHGIGAALFIAGTVIMIVQASIGKIEPDYYKTIVLLYNEYRSLYQGWSLPFPEEKMSEWFFSVRLNSYLQKMVGRKQDFTEAVEDPVICKIIQTTRPKKFNVRVMRRLLLSKSYTLLKYYLTLILIVKRNRNRD